MNPPSDVVRARKKNEDIPGIKITPRVRSLIGSLKGANVTEEDHRYHLEEKYQ